MRGGTIIEVLTASMIGSVCIAAMVNLIIFAFNLTTRTDDLSIAYNLARRNAELVKTMGFKYAPEGTYRRYYDRDGANETVSRGGAIYEVEVTITSSELSYNASTGQYRPSDYALRDVVIVVRKVSTNQVLLKSGTLLTRSGV